MLVDFKKIKPVKPLFLFTFEADLNSLMASVKQSGVVTPLLVKKNKTNYQIVSGYKRYLAAKNLKIEKVPVSVSTENDIILFKKTLLENKSIRSFNEVEKSLIIKTAKGLKIADEELIKSYFPFLNIPAKTENIKKYLDLLKLENYWLKQLSKEKITADLAGTILSWSKEARASLQNVYTKFTVNFNKGRELINELDELKLRDRLKIEELLSGLQVKPAKELPAPQQFEILRNAVKKLKQPQKSVFTEKYQGLLRELALNQSISVKEPKNFEGNSLEIQINAASKTELFNKLARLKNSENNPAWEQIFNLL